MFTISAVLYITGTTVAIITNNAGLTTMFFSGITLIGGVHLGHWTEKRNQQMMDQVQERYNVRHT